MLINSQILPILLVLAPFTNASNSDILDDSLLVNIRNPTLHPTLHLTLRPMDFENAFTEGTILWGKALDNNTKNTVMMLDSKVAEIIRQSNDWNSAAALIHGFLEASGDSVGLIVEGIVKIAAIFRAINILQTLQHFYIWSSPEQFHRFQALCYKSECYDEAAWKDNPVPMEWDKNLDAICMTDNSILLSDLASGILSGNPLTFDTNNLLDSIARHDSLHIYRSLDLSPIATHLELLAESGSFKILQYLHNTRSIDLHLENYALPNNLPKDFRFFWMQGYRYLPVSRFLEKACEHGRVDILDFFHQMDFDTLAPNTRQIKLAVRSKRLNILEWVLDHRLFFEHADIVKELILSEHFEIFEQLQERLGFSKGDIQSIANVAVGLDQFDVIEWIYKKFKITPESKFLGNASTNMLEWIELVDPKKIAPVLAENANLNNLKWLSNNHPQLLDFNTRYAHNFKLANFEKIQWMILQGWEVNPSMSCAASHGEMETLEFGYNCLQRKPTREDAFLAASHGQIKVLMLIYSIDPSCIDKYALSMAVGFGDLETAKYLESILNLKNSALRFDLLKAFEFGNLELIEWVYEHYKLTQLYKQWIMKTVMNGHLSVINWALEKRLVLKIKTVRLVETAVRYDQRLILQRLVDSGLITTGFKDYMPLAFRSGSLEALKYLVIKDPKGVQILRDAQPSGYNYHIWLWLQDQISRSDNGADSRECILF